MTIGAPGPAPHVFPHAREAIRCWYSHRTGSPPSRPPLGAVRGKSATSDDAVRVGRVLLGTLRLRPRELEILVAWALGMRQRSSDRATQTLVERVTRRLRSMRIVAEPAPRFSRRRDSWQTADGETIESTYCVDFD